MKGCLIVMLVGLTLIMLGALGGGFGVVAVIVAFFVGIWIAVRSEESLP